jgi:F-type H+-transporting ATPase subunit gamma
MPTQLDIKRRIRSVKNTQQITRAMKFVAAARLRRAHEKALSARPYMKALTRIVQSISQRVPETTHPLLARRQEEKVLLLVVSGERGLAGAFNANIIRRSIEFLRERKTQQLEVITLGRKGRDALRKQSWKIIGEHVDVTSKVDRGRAAEIAQAVATLYQNCEIDAVYIVFNEFKTVLTQIVTLEKLLPIESPSGPPKDVKETPAGATMIDYIYEEPPAQLMASLLPRYLEAQIFRALAESSASEHAARMTAMDSATNNAVELIDKLTLYMNKVRQAAITKEIIEVVSGAASAG